jgi:preprotein translocase subunit SecG
MGGIVLGFIIAVFVVVCFLLVIIILLQDSKDGGLASSAFGGEGLQSVLGGHGAATFLSRATTWLAVAFLCISFVLMRFYGDSTSGQLSPIEDKTVEATSQSGQSSDQKAPAFEANQTEATEDTKVNATEDSKVNATEDSKVNATEDSKANATEDSKAN